MLLQWSSAFDKLLVTEARRTRVPEVQGGSWGFRGVQGDAQEINPDGPRAEGNNMGASQKYVSVLK